MDDNDYETMAALENRHWWYRGLRQSIEQMLRLNRFALPHGARVLDAGCGTGENLRLLQRLIRPSYCGGFDISAKAVEMCREKIGPVADVYVSDIRSPAVHVDELDLIISCDVVSIAGLEASRDGLRSLVTRLRRGGLFVFNLAGLRWLYSSHDLQMQIRDRPGAAEMRQLMADIGLQVEFLTYRMFWLFPAIVLCRLPSILFPRAAKARSDLAPTPRWMNECLARLMSAEAWMLGRGMRFPWGSSVFAIGRKDRSA
jgi:SAM-dependent methyltransferase